jgi:protein O-GlcNAc transferase
MNTLIGSDGLLLGFVPPAHLHRLQNLLYTSGNLRSVIMQDPRAGLQDQIRAIELLLRLPESLESEDSLSFRDLVIASTVIGILGSPSTKTSTLNSIADTLDVDPARFTHRMLEGGIYWLGLVHQAGQKLVDVLLHQGNGALPMVLLTPEMVSRIPETLFSTFSRVLPGLCVRSSYEDCWRAAPGISDSAANRVTSTILLTMAKLLQNKGPKPIPYLFNSLPPSLSLVVILYYLAVSLNPTPSTYNNMGIVFCTIKHTTNINNARGLTETISGVALAQLYYKKGLEMDPGHAHLLTNYGSLLKDQGRPLEAIRLVFPFEVLNLS